MNYATTSFVLCASVHHPSTNGCPVRQLVISSTLSCGTYPCLAVCKHGKVDSQPGGHRFIAVSRLTTEQLSHTAAEIELVLANSGTSDYSFPGSIMEQPSIYSSVIETAQVNRQIPVLKSSELELFNITLSLGIPTVVDAVQDFSPQIWSPSAFMKGQEQAPVLIIEQTGMGEQETSGTLEQFMRVFELPHSIRGYVAKLKACRALIFLSCANLLDRITLPRDYSRLRTAIIIEHFSIAFPSRHTHLLSAFLIWWRTSPPTWRQVPKRARRPLSNQMSVSSAPYP